MGKNFRNFRNFHIFEIFEILENDYNYIFNQNQ